MAKQLTAGAAAKSSKGRCRRAEKKASPSSEIKHKHSWCEQQNQTSADAPELETMKIANLEQ